MDEFETVFGKDRKDKLASLAKQRGGDLKDLAREAIDTFIEKQQHLHAEYQEDLLRWEEYKKNGGIPHERMSEWLKSIGTDSQMSCPEK